MKEAAPSKPPLRELSPLPPTVYIHVCVGIGQEGGSGESTFRGWRIEKTNTGLLLFAVCPVFRYSKRPANMTEAFCRIPVCPDKSKSHAYPGRGFPGAGKTLERAPLERGRPLQASPPRTFPAASHCLYTCMRRHRTGGRQRGKHLSGVANRKNQYRTAAFRGMPGFSIFKKTGKHDRGILPDSGMP